MKLVPVIGIGLLAGLGAAGAALAADATAGAALAIGALLVAVTVSIATLFCSKVLFVAEVRLLCEHVEAMRMSGDLSQRLPVNRGGWAPWPTASTSLSRTSRGSLARSFSMPGGSLRPRSSSPSMRATWPKARPSSAAPPTARCERLTR